MMLHTKYPGFRPCGFILEDFSYFAYIGLCKICDPGAGPFLGPRAIICANWVEVHQVMLNTNYQ